MTTPVFESFLGLANVGDLVELRLISGEGVVGRVRELRDSHVVVVEADESLSLHPAQSIQSFRIRGAPGAAADSGRGTGARRVAVELPRDLPPTPVEPAPRAPPPRATSAPLRTPAPAAPPAPILDTAPFQAEPVVAMPEVSFDVPEVTTRDRVGELNRIRQIYRHAKAVRDLSRLRPQVGETFRYAEAWKSAAAALLAAHFAHQSGHPDAEALFLSAAAEGAMDGLVALASISISHQQWSAAARHLRDALNGLDTADPRAHDISVALGRCLWRCKDREIEGLAALAERPFEADTTRQTLQLVLALALGSTPLNGSSKVYSDAPAVATTLPLAPPARSGQTGFIIAYNPQFCFGYIRNEVQGKSWSFRTAQIRDPLLAVALNAGRLHIEVRFIEDGSARAGTRYPPVLDLEPCQPLKPPTPGGVPAAKIMPSPPNPTEPGKVRAPVGRRLDPLPHRATTYARAKRAEQLDDFPEAERLYKEEIDQRGPSRSSAIKDLSSLLSRLNRMTEAIAVLHTHRSDFRSAKDARTLDNMEVHYQIKAGNYMKAASLLDTLARTSSNAETRRQLERQQAYCYFASGNVAEATRRLEAILRVGDDPATANLLERVKLSQASAIGNSQENEELQRLVGLAYGISPLARHLLNGSDLQGVDDRSRARGYFDEQDRKYVEKILDAVRGRRPRDKAGLLLTLAVLCEKASDAEGQFPFLRRYFNEMAEAAIGENLPVDTVRCFAIESLSIASSGGASSTVHQDRERATGLLLSTYLAERPSAAEMYHDGRFRLRPLLEKFQRDVGAPSRFFADAPYIWAVCRDLALGSADPNHVLQAPKMNAIEKERQRVVHEMSTLSGLKQLRISGVELGEAARTLETLFRSTRFDLDRQRLTDLATVLRDAARYALEPDLLEKEVLITRAYTALDNLRRQILEAPTKLSLEHMLPVAAVLIEQLPADFRAVEAQARPQVEVKDVLAEDYYVLSDGGELTIRLEVNVPLGSAPIEGLEVEAREEDGLKMREPALSPEPLRAGNSRTVELRVMPSETQVREAAFALTLRIRYRLRSGEQCEQSDTSLAIHLKPTETFEPLRINPYQKFSGGTIVDDSGMFFGRKDLVDRILSQMEESEAGRCFVLYGQKRSGKSSVLRQVEKRLSYPRVCVSVTLGELEGKTGLVRLLLDRLEQIIRKNFGGRPDGWPGDEVVREEPLRAFKGALDVVRAHLLSQRGSEPRFILLVDEFTYVYEYMKEGIMDATFMRQWKALLETRLFSAVVAGQDSMPRFKLEYPNEFGVTHDERLTYLSEAEARELAERPILLDKRTRYRGNALRRLLDYTAGSPFYLQVMCDHIVRHLNRIRAPFVTEPDVEIVARRLISGEDCLPMERFDPLITAAGESVGLTSRSNYLRLLRRMAASTSGATLSDLPTSPELEALLADMMNRHVISRDDAGRYAIRVGLFNEWLRANVENARD